VDRTLSLPRRFQQSTRPLDRRRQRFPQHDALPRDDQVRNPDVVVDGIALGPDLLALLAWIRCAVLLDTYLD
jgi:hypothetical protein